MKSNLRCCLLVLTVLFCFASIPAESGIVIVDKEGEKTLLSKGKFKSIPENPDNQWFSYDAKNGTVLMVDPASRTYSRGTMQEYCKATSSLYEESMKGMPADQRRMMEEAMGKHRRKMPAKVAVSKIGDGGFVAGYSTVKYKVVVDGKLYEELWIANAPVIMKEISDAESFARFGREIQQCMSSGTVDLGNEPEFSKDYLSMMKEGIEVKSVHYRNGKAEPGTEIVKIEEKNIPDSEFEPPAGYKKMTLIEMLRSQFSEGDQDDEE